MRCHVHRVRSLGCAVAVAASLGVASDASAFASISFFIRHLSANFVNDTEPRIANGNVVWQSGTGSASEIYLSEAGGRGQPLTQDARADELPDISASQVVWQHFDGADLEIESFDLTTRLIQDRTVDAVDETNPVVSGDNIAFLRSGDPYELPSPGPILSAGTDSDLHISGNNLAFTKDATTDLDVWAWFPNLALDPGLYELSDPADTTDEYAPAISGERVVFVRQTVNSTEIVRFDPNNYPTVSITSDGTPDDEPQIDGDHVVWTRGSGTGREIYRWTDDGVSLPVAVTVNTVADHSPMVNGNDIVWVEDAAAGGSEIWACMNCWSGGTPQRVSHQFETDRNPRIENGIIVYENCENAGTPSEECDILMAPEPGSTLLVATALAALGFLASRSARRAVAIAQVRARH